MTKHGTHELHRIRYFIDMMGPDADAALAIVAAVMRGEKPRGDRNKTSLYLSSYAELVLKHEWPEAEPYIHRQEPYWPYFNKRKPRWRSLHKHWFHRHQQQKG